MISAGAITLGQGPKLGAPALIAPDGDVAGADGIAEEDVPNPKTPVQDGSGDAYVAVDGGARVADAASAGNRRGLLGWLRNLFSPRKPDLTLSTKEHDVFVYPKGFKYLIDSGFLIIKDGGYAAVVRFDTSEEAQSYLNLRFGQPQETRDYEPDEGRVVRTWKLKGDSGIHFEVSREAYLIVPPDFDLTPGDIGTIPLTPPNTRLHVNKFTEPHTSTLIDVPEDIRRKVHPQFGSKIFISQQLALVYTFDADGKFQSVKLQRTYFKEPDGAWGQLKPFYTQTLFQTGQI